ncbi:MAG: glycosyltransferase [Paludibacteraceae bacterium]|nr:glycosyltransferase [Paludibacteraceae bacterium]
MKISIITACLNRASTIGAALNSVMSQVDADYELIVIDGQSTDGTMEIVNQYVDRIAKIVSEPDTGIYEAINKGIRLATGEVIGLVHSDDELTDQYVLRDITERMMQTDADLLYADGLLIDDKGHVVRRWRSGRYSKRRVRHGWLPRHTTCFIRRETYERLGLYDESYHIAADSDLLVRYLYEHDLRVTYLRRYISRSRMGGASTDRRMRKMVWKEDIRMYRSHQLPGVATRLMKVMRKLPQYIHL